MLRLIAAGSPAQSGKCSALRVRQMCTWPFMFRIFCRFTISSAADAADGMAMNATTAATAVERTNAPVRAAKPVPCPEIKPIIASILLVVAMMVAGGDQPAPPSAAHDPVGKELPADMIGNPHEGHHA